MRKQGELQELLEDVLHDERVESLEASIRLACRAELARKRQPWFRWWLVPAAAAILLIALRLFVFTGSETLAPMRTDSHSYYVFTAPLDNEQLVTTPSRTAEAYRIRTRSKQDYLVSGHGFVEKVRSSPTDLLEEITDEEMLTLFAGIPCGLIERGDDRKTLIFIHPEDENRFMPGLGG
jgi:hypothetical protein